MFFQQDMLLKLMMFFKTLIDAYYTNKLGNKLNEHTNEKAKVNLVSINNYLQDRLLRGKNLWFFKKMKF